MTASGRRTGRPAGGDGSNRQRILEAARAEFAANGFRKTTMRSVSARAGVDVALLPHYFGSKDGLFLATLDFPEGSRGMLIEALSGPRAALGANLTRGYLTLWEDPETSSQMQIIARAALNNEASSGGIRDLVADVLDAPGIATALTGREPGFGLAMAHLLGIAVTRHLARLPAIVDLDFETLVARTAPAVQLHLDADID